MATLKVSTDWRRYRNTSERTFSTIRCSSACWGNQSPDEGSQGLYSLELVEEVPQEVQSKDWMEDDIFVTVPSGVVVMECVRIFLLMKVNTRVALYMPWEEGFLTFFDDSVELIPWLLSY